MHSRADAIAKLNAVGIGPAAVDVVDVAPQGGGIAKRRYVIKRGDSTHTVTLSDDPQDWELALLARQLPLANRGQRIAALASFADGRPIDLDLQHPLKVAASGNVSPQRNRDR